MMDSHLYSTVSLVAGIVISLRNLLKDDDITVRQKSTECLYVMSCKLLLNIFSAFFVFHNNNICVKIFQTVCIIITKHGDVDRRQLWALNNETSVVIVSIPVNVMYCPTAMNNLVDLLCIVILV